MKLNKPLLTKYRENIWDDREHWVCEGCCMVYSRPAPDLDDLRIEDFGEHVPVWRSPLCSYCGGECVSFSLQDMMHNRLMMKKLDRMIVEREQ